MLSMAAMAVSFLLSGHLQQEHGFNVRKDGPHIMDNVLSSMPNTRGDNGDHGLNQLFGILVKNLPMMVSE